MRGGWAAAERGNEREELGHNYIDHNIVMAYSGREGTSERSWAMQEVSHSAI